MAFASAADRNVDHCRIGSLEIPEDAQNLRKRDHCRIGSLEINFPCYEQYKLDHCRIGSLETRWSRIAGQVDRSLPHRQLRNFRLLI